MEAKNTNHAYILSCQGCTIHVNHTLKRLTVHSICSRCCSDSIQEFNGIERYFIDSCKKIIFLPMEQTHLELEDPITFEDTLLGHAIAYPICECGYKHLNQFLTESGFMDKPDDVDLNCFPPHLDKKYCTDAQFECTMSLANEIQGCNQIP